MNRRLGQFGLLVLLAVAAPAAFAQNDDGTTDEDLLSTEEFVLMPGEWWLPGDDNDGRQDVREVTMPPAPSGPATPVPFCNPSDPICP